MLLSRSQDSIETAFKKGIQEPFYPIPFKTIKTVFLQKG